VGTVANSQPITAQVTTPVTNVPARNIAMDAYRGFVMLLMMGEVLQFERVYKAFPESSFWRILSYNQTHVEWAGCSLHDMIQPSFSFLVGVALPYSLASRMAKGQTESRLFLHALWRSFLLIALGIFLRSMHSSQTYFTFEDTLTQIGLGYPFLFLLGLRQRKWQWTAFGVILFAYWLAWALYPLPPANFDLSAVGVPSDWHRMFDYSGFAAHWNKNANLGNAFDQWFLNLFPRKKPFVFNGGGYLTLSFIPTLGTMILGLVAGGWLREAAPRIPFKKFLIAGAAGVLAALLLHFTGICPVVKRIWTPAWTLFSGGVCFFFLAAFSWVIEAKGYKKWAFPLVVVGMNSIAAYLIAHLFEEFIADSLRINLGADFFAFLGTGLQPLLNGAAMLLTYWLILFWMYRRKLFLKI
jgi:heparan-alpha-glucosaminide N-acetyltransferase